MYAEVMMLQCVLFVYNICNCCYAISFQNMWRLSRMHYLFAFISRSLNLMYEVRSAAWFICFLLTAPTIVFKMPKDPTPLYSHRSRNATARQLNITTNASGRSSYSFTSTHVPVEPAVPEPHTEPEYYAPDSNMDVDGA